MTASVSLGSLGLQPSGLAEVDPFLDPLCFTQPDFLPLCVYRGDSGRFRLAVTEPDLVTPIDITGGTWDADIRQTEDGTLVGSFNVVPVAGTTNAVDVILTAELSELLDLPLYVYDVELTIASEVVTLVYGDLTVTKDVSREDEEPPPAAGVFTGVLSALSGYVTVVAASGDWPTFPAPNAIGDLSVKGVDVGSHKFGGAILAEGIGWWSADQVSNTVSIRAVNLDGVDNSAQYAAIDGTSVTVEWGTA
jgi:hypothetical protein